MFEKLKQKFSEWLEDTAHWLKTGGVHDPLLQ
jgi:hypothetical protein